jgi:hypothetical protein
MNRRTRNFLALAVALIVSCAAGMSRRGPVLRAKVTPSDIALVARGISPSTPTSPFTQTTEPIISRQMARDRGARQKAHSRQLVGPPLILNDGLIISTDRPSSLRLPPSELLSGC